MVSKTEKVLCPNCQKKIASGNLAKHQKTKKCKNHNDKTTDRSNSPALMAAKTSPLPPNNEKAAISVVSHSKILTEINLNGEFETMSEKVTSKKKDSDDGYEHSCGAKFKDKLKYCPGCGDELEA